MIVGMHFLAFQNCMKTYFRKLMQNLSSANQNNLNEYKINILNFKFNKKLSILLKNYHLVLFKRKILYHTNLIV